MKSQPLAICDRQESLLRSVVNSAVNTGAHHGDTVYLTPDETRLHRFEDKGLFLKRDLLREGWMFMLCSQERKLPTAQLWVFAQDPGDAVHGH